MGSIYEDIEIDGIKIRAKIDTGSDFPLAFKKDTIERLHLKPVPDRVAIIRKRDEKIISPVYIGKLKIRECEFGPLQAIVESGSDDLLGHPILQALGAKIDENTHSIQFDMEKCPCGDTGGISGEIVAIGDINAK